MNYHNIVHDDMLNGEGLRVTLFLSGCSHHCEGCQNPQTWNPDGGILFDKNALQEIFKQLQKPYISGITFSGGDPLHENNVLCVFCFILSIKENFPTKNIWLYSGYVWEDIFGFDNIQEDCTIKGFRMGCVQNCDVFVDGKFDKNKLSPQKKWVGSENQ